MKHTYYRSFQNIKDVFERSGVSVSFNVLGHPVLQKNKIIKIFILNKVTRKIAECLLLTFVSIEVVAKRLNRKER